jgi:hypothetical protein
MLFMALAILLFAFGHWGWALFALLIAVMES